MAKDPQCRLCGEAPEIDSVQSTAADACAGLDTGDIALIPPAALAARLESADAPCLIDVRETAELDIARFTRALSLPLSELPARVGELSPGGQYVITCHHGARSLRAAQLLREHGFSNLATLDGGIDAWARQIDHSMARY